MYINICICRRCVYPRRVHLDVNNTARKEEEGAGLQEEQTRHHLPGGGISSHWCSSASSPTLRFFFLLSSSSSSCRFLFLSFSLLELSVCVIGVNVWSAPKHMNQELRTNGHDPHPSAGRLRRDKTAPKRAPCCVPPNRYNSISRQHRWWLSLSLFIFYFFIFFLS